jgi:hypothetical protein
MNTAEAGKSRETIADRERGRLCSTHLIMHGGSTFPKGLEPLTFGSGGRRSVQLSYGNTSATDSNAISGPVHPRPIPRLARCRRAKNRARRLKGWSGKKPSKRPSPGNLDPGRTAVQNSPGSAAHQCSRALSKPRAHPKNHSIPQINAAVPPFACKHFNLNYIETAHSTVPAPRIHCGIRSAKLA